MSAARLDLTPAWRNAYADRRGYFAYTLFDAAGHPLMRSPNLDAPLPFFGVPGHATFAPINLVGVGTDRRAIIAARAPDGDVLVVARRNIVRQVARSHGGDVRFMRGVGIVIVTLPDAGAPSPVARRVPDAKAPQSAAPHATPVLGPAGSG